MSKRSLINLLVLGTALLLFVLYPGRSLRMCSASNQGADVSPFASPEWATVSLEELRKYKHLWAVSDIHGRIDYFVDLLKAAKLITQNSTADKPRWSDEGKEKHLFISLGDYIDKEGEDSAGVLLLLQELSRQAALSGSRLIVLLGNHDAQFLADPKENATKEFLKSARGKLPGKDPAEIVSPQELYQSKIGQYMRTLPLGAVVGNWLFAHSGYLHVKRQDDESTDRANLREYIGLLSEARRHEDYQALTDKDSKLSSLLEAHDWVKDHADKMHYFLQLLGLDGMVVGHEPNLLGAVGTIAIERDGWFLKLDTGMNKVREESDGELHRGRLLHCEVSKILPPGGATRLALRNAQGLACKQTDERGRELEIPLRSFHE